MVPTRNRLSPRPGRSQGGRQTPDGPGDRGGHDGVAAAIADHDDRLRLPDWLDAKRLVKATLALVGGLHVTSEVTGVDLRYATLTADNAAPQLFRHRPASLRYSTGW